MGMDRDFALITKAFRRYDCNADYHKLGLPYLNSSLQGWSGTLGLKDTHVWSLVSRLQST